MECVGKVRVLWEGEVVLRSYGCRRVGMQGKRRPWTGLLMLVYYVCGVVCFVPAKRRGRVQIGIEWRDEVYKSSTE